MRAMDDDKPKPCPFNFHCNTPRLGGWLLLESHPSIDHHRPNYHSHSKQSHQNLQDPEAGSTYSHGYNSVDHLLSLSAHQKALTVHHNTDRNNTLQSKIMTKPLIRCLTTTAQAPALLLVTLDDGAVIFLHFKEKIK